LSHSEGRHEGSQQHQLFESFLHHYSLREINLNRAPRWKAYRPDTRGFAA
jgi:hypothetical protein